MKPKNCVIIQQADGSVEGFTPVDTRKRSGCKASIDAEGNVLMNERDFSRMQKKLVIEAVGKAFG